jgi:hydrogenase nickel incorporation protein HypB
MCATCGCSEVDVSGLDAGGPDHDHHHTHDHPHPTSGQQTLTLEQRVLAKNDERADRNRSWLAAHDVHAVNIMSSPGAGKTTLLVRTILEVGTELPIYVVEGDQETSFDADRISATGAPVLQLNTGSGCHLDATMLTGALTTLAPVRGALVIVENVGNLVCPALFDLGESRRVVVMSVTEGADKPLKYPHIFRSATVVVLNKIDLLPYVDFDVARFEHDVRVVNPHTDIVPVSATRGDGLPAWYHWAQGLSFSP